MNPGELNKARQVRKRDMLSQYFNKPNENDQIGTNDTGRIRKRDNVAQYLGIQLNDNQNVISNVERIRKRDTVSQYLGIQLDGNQNVTSDDSWYPCDVPNCHRKYKKKERLDEHLLKDHSNESNNNLWYVCSVGCNRQYKRKEKLVEHLLKEHQIVNLDIQPIEITKNNKQQMKNEINDNLIKESHENMIMEIDKKKQIVLQAKREAEEQYKQEHLEKFILIEKEKLLEQEKKLKLEQLENQLEEQFISLIQSIKSNVENDATLCCICSENNANTAVIPCGHKFFCFDCIDNYHKTYTSRGCPICRENILCVTKIFS